MVRDLGHELDALRVGRVVDAALEDAASVAVGGDLDAVGGDGVVDELAGRKRESRASGQSKAPEAFAATARTWLSSGTSRFRHF